MTDWLKALDRQGSPGDGSVLVTVARTEGSAPREAGTRMVVTASVCSGTIGGGELEMRAIRTARKLLDDRADNSLLHRYALGTNLGQCCGGVVWLLLEPIWQTPGWLQPLREGLEGGVPLRLVSRTDDPQHKLLIDPAGQLAPCGNLGDHAITQEALRLATSGTGADSVALVRVDGLPDTAPLMFEPWLSQEPSLLVFGAGHVGRALVEAMHRLPFRITWIDSRPDPFPETVPASVTIRSVAEMLPLVDAAPADSYFVILTHSHSLDLALCNRILRRSDFAYCGLIGSRSKRANFEHRLREFGLETNQLNRLQCPIGVPGIRDKRPAAIAVSVAAELLQRAERYSSGVIPQEQEATSP